MSDASLTRRATLTMAAVTAASVAVIVAVVVGIAITLTVREQHRDARRIVREAATTANSVDNPPNGVTLLRSRHDRVWTSEDPPAELADLDVCALPEGASQLDLGADETYEIFVSDRDDVRTVAALNLDYREPELHRLLSGLLPAGAVGVVASALGGAFLARRAVRPLTAALAMQRRFVADASHELRTPLTILNIRAELLRRRHPELGDGIDDVLDDTRALAEIIDDLLLSVELAHRPAEFEEVDLAAVAGTVVASFSPLADRADVELSLETEPAAPVRGVPVALRRAIGALVDNSLAHTPAGGHIRVSVGPAAHPGTVEVRVVDDGSGIDPARATELVKRFARGTDAPGGGRRFGLGLALVQEVAQAHRGTLTLDGAPGRGAIVTIALPAVGPGHERTSTYE